MLLITAKEILIFSYLTKFSIILALITIGIIVAAAISIVYYVDKAESSEGKQAEELYAKCRKTVVKAIIALFISFLAILATPGSEGYRRTLINKYQQETQVNYDEAEFRVNQILGRRS